MSGVELGPRRHIFYTRSLPVPAAGDTSRCCRRKRPASSHQLTRLIRILLVRGPTLAAGYGIAGVESWDQPCPRNMRTEQFREATSSFDSIRKHLSSPQLPFLTSSERVKWLQKHLRSRRTLLRFRTLQTALLYPHLVGTCARLHPEALRDPCQPSSSPRDSHMHQATSQRLYQIQINLRHGMDIHQWCDELAFAEKRRVNKKTMFCISSLSRRCSLRIVSHSSNVQDLFFMILTCQTHTESDIVYVLLLLLLQVWKNLVVFYAFSCKRF